MAQLKLRKSHQAPLRWGTISHSIIRKSDFFRNCDFLNIEEGRYECGRRVPVSYPPPPLLPPSASCLRLWLLDAGTVCATVLCVLCGPAQPARAVRCTCGGGYAITLGLSSTSHPTFKSQPRISEKGRCTKTSHEQAGRPACSPSCWPASPMRVCRTAIACWQPLQLPTSVIIRCVASR